MAPPNHSPSLYHRSPSSGSPIFDIPEFPALRRVKPLPKRRRVNTDEDDAGLVARARTLASAAASTVSGLAPPLSADTIAPIPLDATPEELIAHAERLKTEMAAQGYEQYLPILGGVQDLFRGVAAAAAAASAAGNGGNPGGRSRGSRNSIAASVSDLGNKLSLASEALEKALAHAAAAGVGLPGSGGTIGGLSISEDDDLGDSDYMDHLQQPGNTKKRKVPANASGFSRGRGRDSGSGQSGGEDDGSERERDLSGEASSGAGRPDGAPGSKHFFQSSLHPSRKSRLPAITLAGLQHKKTVASRKKQLADVLVSLSLNDTMSLDQALSNNYPFAAAAASLASATTNKGADPNSGPKIRLSRRNAPRLARLAKRALRLRHPDMAGFTVSDFTFRCPSSSSERLGALKDEVAMLKTRFEAELARQSAKAKLAAANKMMASFPAKGSRHKRSGGGTDRAQRQRTIAPASSGKGGDQNAEFLDHGLVPGVPKTKVKKKKRSALANASNPHHLRNYVPSRFPHSGTGNAQQANQTEANYLSPLPLRFLSADLPPRRKRSHKVNAQPTANLTNPADEWICAFCEYELFYGDEQDYRRAIRQRKKILRRRRRAQERAAAAASGNSALKTSEKVGRDDEDEEAEFEQPFEEYNAVPKQTKWKDPHKDKERGEEAANG